MGFLNLGLSMWFQSFPMQHPASLQVYSFVKLARPLKGAFPRSAWLLCYLYWLSCYAWLQPVLVSFFLTCRWSVWMSWWIVPVWKAAWGHPEFKHTLWEPKMIKYSKKRPTDWLNLFQGCRCGDRNDSAVWLSIPCLSLGSKLLTH